MRTPRTLVVLAAAAALLAACGGDAGGGETTKGAAEELVGLFSVAPGTCTDDGAIGSYFRMVQAGGDAEAGPFMTNGDSPCADQTWSTLEPGTDGGLLTGAYQPATEPHFAPDGTSTATRVIQPARFFAIGFGMATDEVDAQTERSVPAPRVTVDGTRLTGDLSAISVSWNQQYFNQGAPKPGDAAPVATGSYDPDTGAYTLDWVSPIVGGPFDGFSGIWHFEGTFTES